MKEGEPVLGGNQASPGNIQSSSFGTQPTTSTTPQNPQPIQPAQPANQLISQTFAPNNTAGRGVQLNNLVSQPQTQPQPQQTAPLAPPIQPPQPPQSPAQPIAQQSQSFPQHHSPQSLQFSAQSAIFPAPATSQFTSPVTGDIILSKEKKKSRLGIIVLIVVVLLVIIAGVVAGLYFARNNTTQSQSQTLPVDNYRELADTLTEIEAKLLSVPELAEEGLNGEINSYTFLLSSYADEQDEISTSIDEAKAAIPRMSDYLNSLTQSDMNDDIKNMANAILNNYDSYSTSVDSIAQKIQSFRAAFLKSNQNELDNIMASSNLPVSTVETVNSYEQGYQEIKSKTEECVKESGHSVSECVRSVDLYWVYRNIMESDHQTIIDLFSKIIDNSQLKFIKSANNDILSLRKLIEVELWELKSE